MKQKQLIKCLMAAAALLTGLTSCDKDNEESAAQLVAGAYPGYSVGASSYFSGMIGQDENVALTANGDGTLNLAYTSGTWGNASFSNLAAVKGADGYTVSGSGKYSMGHGGSTAEYDCSISGTVSSGKDTYSFAFSLPAVMGGLTITFYNGEPLAAMILAGSYSGWSKFVFTYMPDGMSYDNQTIVLAANEDGSVKLTYTSDDLGSCELANVAVSEDGGTGYKLTGEGVFLMGMSGTPKEYDCIFEGTVSGDKETYSMVFSIPAVMGGSTITFQNGTVPAE